MSHNPAPQKHMSGATRYGFHPAQYRKAQANDVYRQYQKQIAKDKEETLKKRSERSLDGKLKINNIELVFLTINSRRWFGISQIVSVLFSHRPRSSVVTRMKMLGIEFYCGNYDELRRMKELGGVETHCSRCKLISEQDLVKLLLCFYRFTALPRGKGKISTNGLSTYLDDILREIALGRVELGKDFHEDDTGKIDDVTWSQISERMLLKNAEKNLKVEYVHRYPKRDMFDYDDANEMEFVLGDPKRYVPREERVVRGQKLKPKSDGTVEQQLLSPVESEKQEQEEESELVPETKKEEITQDVQDEVDEKPDSMATLLPKLIKAERTKKTPRAIWPRWYPPQDEKHEVSLESGVQSLFYPFNVDQAQGKYDKIAKYILEGQRRYALKNSISEESQSRSAPALSLKNIKFEEDDAIQIITRQDLERQFNRKKLGDKKNENSLEFDDCTEDDTKNVTFTKEKREVKDELVEYTPEQLEYLQKIKESFDFPYAFPCNKHLNTGNEQYDYKVMMKYPLWIPNLRNFKRNPVLDTQMFKRFMEQKRHAKLKTDFKKGIDRKITDDQKNIHFDYSTSKDNLYNNNGSILKSKVLSTSGNTERIFDISEDEGSDTEATSHPRKRFRKTSAVRGRLGSGGSSEDEVSKPDHIYRFKFKTVPDTQDYPYMSAKPTSLLSLVKLDRCNYPVGCRSAPFLFDIKPFSSDQYGKERGPFVRQYDIEPTSDNVWSGVSLWYGDEDTDSSDTASSKESSQSAPELYSKANNSTCRKTVSANASPDRYTSGLDMLSSVAYNAQKLTPTKSEKRKQVLDGHNKHKVSRL